MGTALAELAIERGHDIHAVIGRGENANGRALTAERMRGADMALEFTEPHAAPDNVAHLIRAGIPVVTGTTGWRDRLPEIVALVRARGGALLHAPNFSVGVQLFLRTARELARSFAVREGFEAYLLDEHHASKRDAPSGTALAIKAALQAEDPARAFPITSIRAGSHPGRHRVTYDAAYETIVLQHETRDRRVFALGALAAAEWLAGKTGVFTFEEMLFERES